ncbi:MAG TPA: tripartite tricarboxylate transporter substrate binding protein [Eoetvoesiella sp.]
MRIAALRKFVGVLGLFLCPMLFPGVSTAASAYPERPVTMVIPWSVGGSTDVLGRVLADSMAKHLGVSIVVENKPGATGTIGYRNVAQAAPDGYTILLGTNSTFAMAPHYYKDLPFDLDKDFRPVGMIGGNPQILSVHPSVPAHTVKEFIAYLKKNPGKVPFASAGHGGSSHLAMEMFLGMTGTEMLHVPYRGGAPAVQSVLAKDTMAAFVDISIGEPLIRSGAIRALGTSGGTRTPSIPNVPTIAEAGVPGFESLTSFGLFAPAKVSDEVVTKLHAALAAALKDPLVVKRLSSFGYELTGGEPSEYAAYAKAEYEKWGKVISERNISLK